MSRRSLVPPVLVVPLAFAALKLGLHALAATNYGYFRDELYYIACSKHLAWQVQTGWPTLEFMRNAASGKMVRTGFVAFWSQQLLVMNPATVPVWLTGLVALLASRRVRILGIVFVAVAALLLASGSSRPNYLAVAYAPLFAAGGMAIERASSARRRAWLRPVALASVTLVGAPVVPLGLPLLPVDRQVAYTGALGLRPRARSISSVHATGCRPRFRRTTTTGCGARAAPPARCSSSWAAAATTRTRTSAASCWPTRPSAITACHSRTALRSSCAWG